MSVSEVYSEDELISLSTEDASRLLIVKFGADWCRPCQILQPHIKDLAAELEKKQRGCTVVTVDKTDDTEPMFEKYEISKLPTVLLMLNGEVKETIPRPDIDNLRMRVFTLAPPPALCLDEDF